MVRAMFGSPQDAGEDAAGDREKLIRYLVLIACRRLEQPVDLDTDAGMRQAAADHYAALAEAGIGDDMELTRLAARYASDPAVTAEVDRRFLECRRAAAEHRAGPADGAGGDRGRQ
jgi:hypothetical protein